MNIQNLKFTLRASMHWVFSIIGGVISMGVIALVVAAGMLLVGAAYHFLGTLAAIIASVVALVWMIMLLKLFDDFRTRREALQGEIDCTGRAGFDPGVVIDGSNKEKPISVYDIDTWIKHEINEKRLNISGFPKDIAEKTIANHIRSAEERGEIETRIDSKLMMWREIETVLRDRIEKKPARIK